MKLGQLSQIWDLKCMQAAKWSFPMLTIFLEHINKNGDGYKYYMTERKRWKKKSPNQGDNGFYFCMLGGVCGENGFQHKPNLNNGTYWFTKQASYKSSSRLHKYLTYS